MGELAGGLAIELNYLYAKCFQHCRHYDSANGVHCVYHNFEACLADSLYVNCLQVKYALDVLPREIVLSDMADSVYIGKLEIIAFCKAQDGFSLLCGKEFALIVKKFEGVPLARVVGCGKDDSAVCI